MGRDMLYVAGALIGLGHRLHAQPSAPSQEAPAAPPVGNTPPGPSLTEPTVDRHGFVLLGGVTTSGGTNTLRLDTIVPVPVSGAARLRFGLISEYAHASASSGGTYIDAYALVVVPSAYYDWRLPIATTAGDFVFSAEGGIGAERLWLKIDQPFMPGTYETFTVGVLRFAGAFQFRSHNGLVLSVQPLGVYAPLNNVSSSSGSGLTTKTAWEGALLCGYHFP